MTKAPICLQDLRRSLYVKAKAEPTWRFWGRMRSRKRPGFGWQRWSRTWLYEKLGLYNGYRLHRLGPLPKASPAGAVS
jgi:hypothetical protein